MKTKLKDVRVDFKNGFIEIKDGTMNIRHDKVKIEFLSELFYRLKSWGERDEEFNEELSALVKNWEEKGADRRTIMQHCRSELTDNTCLEEIANYMYFTEECDLDELKREHLENFGEKAGWYFGAKHHGSVSKRVAEEIVTEAIDNEPYYVCYFVEKYEEELKQELESSVFGSVKGLLECDLGSVENRLFDEWDEYLSIKSDDAIRRTLKEKCNPKPPNGGQAAEEHGIREAKA